jgi:hypothetical protein
LLLMLYPTIDQQDTVDLFHQLMQPESPFRVLRLLGSAKIGKSHLVTKVFPALARETYQTHCAVLDLRNKAQTITDILHLVYSLLSHSIPFPAYYAAYREWLNRSRVGVGNVHAVLSFLTIRAGEAEAESRRWARHLTAQLVVDLHKSSDGRVVLLFDAVDAASENTRDWLMDILLAQLAALSHLRLVVAGRGVPEPHGSYAAFTRSYELQPVKEINEYISYCRQIGAALDEPSIRSLALAFDYIPGSFADVMPKFTHQEVARG